MASCASTWSILEESHDGDPDSVEIKKIIHTRRRVYILAPSYTSLNLYTYIAPSPLPERYPMVLKTENSDDVQIISQFKTTRKQRHNRRRPATVSSSLTQEGHHQR